MTSSEPASKFSPKTRPLDWVRGSGQVDLVLQDIETKLRQRKRRRIRTGAAALSLLLVGAITFLAVPYYRETATVASQSAQRRTLALTDGSTAELNAQTELHSDFRYGRRRVRLERGEAFFSVVKDPAHPFLVETPAGIVRVTGTQFNVRLTADHSAEITLLEGVVAVKPLTGSELHLVPGQQATVESSHGAVRSLPSAEIDRVTAWRQGRLVLDGLTLGEAVARISGYHGKIISVAPEVASLKMGGSCPLDDLPGFLEYLPQALSVRVLARGNGTFQVIAR